MKNNWIPITTLPPVDEDEYSEDIHVKVDGKKYTGWYDGYTKKWYRDDKDEVTLQCEPTHWQPIIPKK